MHDAFDQRGQGLEGVTLFVRVVMSIVGSTYAAQAVAQALLGDIDGDAAARQQRAG